MLYCAVIGDIIGSRKLPDRNDAQNRFRAMADKANLQYNADIVSPLTVTIGDEFQVLLQSIQAAPVVIEQVKQEMAPIELVFGVGIGEIVTDINTQMAIGMDGPAFYFARQALGQAKKKKPRIIYRSDFVGMDMINSLQYFIESCSARRTNRQRQVLELLNQGFTQEEIAADLHIKQQSVSDIINASYLYEVKEAQRSISAYLKNII